MTWLETNCYLKNSDYDVDVQQEMEQKREVRREVLAKRHFLTEPERCAKSLAITTRLLHLTEFKSARFIHLYLSFRDEVETFEILQKALSFGKEVSVPVIFSTGAPKDIRLMKVDENSSKDLGKGPFGIPQPVWDPQQEVRPDRVDLWIVPGIAFDADGRRLGYGGGYYDRTLSRTNGIVLALSFEVQIVKKLPEQDSDIRVHAIITEGRTIVCSPTDLST